MIGARRIVDGLREWRASLGRPRGGEAQRDQGAPGAGAGASPGLAAAAGAAPRRQSTYVIGFRDWVVMLDEDRSPVLASCVRPCMWHERRLVARHLTDRGKEMTGHRVPGRRCDCGIYAVHHTSSAWLERLGGRGTILGAVRLSGLVRRHRDEGLRAEIAEVVALARPSEPLCAFTRFPLHQGCRGMPTEPVDLEDLAARYGVPIVEPRHLTMVALEHGSLLWP